MRRQIELLTFVLLGLSSCGRLESPKSSEPRPLYKEINESLVTRTVSPNNAALTPADGARFECILGSSSSAGSIKAKFRVTGLFDTNKKLSGVKISSPSSFGHRYDVIAQSVFDRSAENMLTINLAHEDGAAYYEAEITLKNAHYTGSVAEFSVKNPAAPDLYLAEYNWTALFNVASNGFGACYCPSCSH